MVAARYLILSVCVVLMLPAAVRSAESPAQASISAAQAVLKGNPESAEAYAALAVALARRARETSDTRYYDEAQAAAQRSLEIEPANLAAERALTWVLLGKHEFAEALGRAQALNTRIPDDVLTYGFLADANVELGNYPAAEEAVQWMLNLRAGNIPALTRAAHLRELFGDVEGALELMIVAHERTDPSEVEDRAWILTHMAHLELMRGRIDLAEPLLDQALLLFPDYHYALANLARVRLAQDRAQDGVELLERRYRSAPHPENLYVLGEALLRAGQPEKASAAFAEFEQKARLEMPKWDNANRDLILYLVDHAKQPDAALEVAELESARRRDVYTLEALAWALHANGRYAEARQSIEEALAVGIREPNMLYRAAAIAEATGDLGAARAYAAQSLQLGPRNEMAPPARELVSRLQLSAAQ
jgi:tetratricopeptide (TPR) repeat protein